MLTVSSPFGAWEPKIFNALRAHGIISARLPALHCVLVDAPYYPGVRGACLPATRCSAPRCWRWCLPTRMRACPHLLLGAKDSTVPATRYSPPKATPTPHPTRRPWPRPFAAGARWTCRAAARVGRRQRGWRCGCSPRISRTDRRPPVRPHVCPDVVDTSGAPPGPPVCWRARGWLGTRGRGGRRRRSRVCGPFRA